MKRLAWLFCWVLTLASAQAAEPKPAIGIVSAEFGLFDASDPKTVVFEPTDVVPFREGQRYGWIISLHTKLQSVAVREEYLLPTAATEAGSPLTPVEGKLTQPLPRRHQVSQRQLRPQAGQIIGEWAIGPGEPAGKRHLQVIVEGVLAGSFEFEVR